MAPSKSFSNIESGFSLVETLVVISILGILAVTPLLALRYSTERLAFREAQATILGALEQARNRAATGFGATAHGVHIESGSVIAFEGDMYVPDSGIAAFLPSTISLMPANLSVVFPRLTARPAADTSITLENSLGASSTITVHTNGSIDVQE